MKQKRYISRFGYKHTANANAANVTNNTTPNINKFCDDSDITL